MQEPKSNSTTPALTELVQKVMSINNSVLGLQQNTKSDTKSDTNSNIDIAKLNEILAQLMECLSKLKDELATDSESPLVPPNAPLVPGPNTPLVPPHALPNTNADADADAEPECEVDFVEQIIDCTAHELADLIFDEYFGHSVDSSANVGKKNKKKGEQRAQPDTHSPK